MTSSPVLASTREELAGLLADARRSGEPFETGAARPPQDKRVCLVPTMGALHDGHASLMRTARGATSGPVVVSIFVNPMQFAPTEDLDRYPRTLDADLEVCAAEGVDIVFAPSVEEMYPGGFSHDSVHAGVTVSPGALADILDGESRPGHFDGVLTVVAKLFGLVRPDLAVFGEKDYQQLTLVRRMVRDLCMGIDIIGAETVREADGLALSSRNRYLDAEQRRTAVALSRALRAAQERAPYGVPAARWAAMAVLNVEPGLELDYLALTSPDLGEAPESGEGRILVAARVGTTRLIDNMPIVFDRITPDLTSTDLMTAGTATAASTTP
ncbi:pantoate--beta-alanine ligase [Nocardia sp. N13]|uniref:pantoate--beta-alanine ligase n=1 Tax=Nocardioides sp. N13(2025) TaxID=3453405 RepID=UPI003F761681